jgi:hypothetical protein
MRYNTSDLDKVVQREYEDSLLPEDLIQREKYLAKSAE